MLTHPEFTPHTTAGQAAGAFAASIQGKTVAIIGVGPKSLGEALAVAVASQRPALLILASRTRVKLEQVVARIAAKSPTVKVQLIVVDLSVQASVRQAAKQISQLTEKIDVLINNAATNPGTHELTEDGIEMQFGTNHIGPFLLTNLLLPTLRNAAEASNQGRTRIVNVTSAGHRLSPIRFHDYNFEGKEIPSDEQPPAGLPDSITYPGKRYSPFISYGQSKTANILFSLYLSQHLRSVGILSFAVHPGSIWTNLSRSLNAEQVDIISKTGNFWKTQDQGAAPMIVAAFDPGLDDGQNFYLHECEIAEPARHAGSLEIARNLWGLSERIVGEKFDLFQPTLSPASL